jgi:hypothetical protein
MGRGAKGLTIMPIPGENILDSLKRTVNDVSKPQKTVSFVLEICIFSIFIGEKQNPGIFLFNLIEKKMKINKVINKKYSIKIPPSGFLYTATDSYGQHFIDYYI